MTRGRTAIVIGAGPGGLAAALALRAGGMDPITLERASWPGSAGTGLTLWPNALTALRAIGMKEAVLKVAEPCEGIEIRTPGGGLLDATPAGLLRRQFGSPGITLHRADLVGVLLRHLGEEQVRLGPSCVGFRESADGVVALLEGGGEVHGDMLVGADGMRSTIRAQLTGVPDDLRYAGFVVYRGITAHDLSGAPGTLTMGRGAQFGMFPMTRGRAYWFASLSASSTGPHSPDDVRRRLHASFHEWYAPIPQLIAATPAREIVVSAVYDRGPVPAWSVGRVALLGDAAHPSTPSLGQGTCQAFEDAVVLARSLRGTVDLPTGLRTYELHRRGRADAITVQARRLGKIGQWRNPAACWLRNQLIKHMPHGSRVRQLRQTFAFDET